MNPKESNQNESQTGLLAYVQNLWLKQRLLVFTVIVPTLLALVFNGLIASDVYTSEARFVVRSPERQAVNPLGAIFSGSGFSSSVNDTYTVQDYVLSRDAMAALEGVVDLRESFGKGDWFTRFPGPGFDDSNERMHEYYQSRVHVRHDPITSIATMRVSAYEPQVAYNINNQLLTMGEDLVNQLNERGRQDMIRFATNEVQQAEVKAKAAVLALAQYRTKVGVIDPERQTAIPLQQIAKLQDELLNTRSQLAQLQMLASNNPQIPVLRQRISLLENEIEKESARVTGSGGGSLANRAAEFQRLSLDREFADRQLASTLGSLEQARSEAQRQQLYLERIVQPSLPDAAMAPRRLRNVFTVFLLGLVAWGVITMVYAGIREHLD